jgi:4-hydroxythreonine-4-phosphate dehydrogenase
MKPVIAITMGDCNGIGPEVALKSAVSSTVGTIATPLLIGSLDVFTWYARRLKIRVNLKEVDMFPFAHEQGAIPVLNLHTFETPRIRPGTVSKGAGQYAAEAIELGVGLALNNLADAIVTAPVSKEALHLAGWKFPGQTEMLAARTKTKNVMMMLLGHELRVGLTTVHLPLKDVSRTISRRLILERLETMYSSLKRDFAIRAPKIGILGLNPHAGENGHLGHEEKQIILPAIRIARSKRINVEGPFPADAFFGTHAYRNYDATLAMYHDQGLIPLKMKSFEVGVNYSAGLPVVRTSPDHGTAFDIAGDGVANPSSMIEAIKLAVTIAGNRKRTWRSTIFSSIKAS